MESAPTGLCAFDIFDCRGDSRIALGPSGTPVPTEFGEDFDILPVGDDINVPCVRLPLFFLQDRKSPRAVSARGVLFINIKAPFSRLRRGAIYLILMSLPSTKSPIPSTTLLT